MNAKSLISIVAILLSGITTTFGQIVAWDTAGLSGYGASPFSPTTVNENLTVGGLTRGGGITTGGTVPANVWGGTGWDTSATSVSAAISANEFATFTIKANAGYEVSFSSINVNFRRSSGGPNSFQWQYSLNGTDFSNIGSVFSYTGTESDGLAQTSITLSAISSLQSVTESTTVSFRLVMFNASSSTGTWGIGRLSGNDLVIAGTVSTAAIPEPSTYAAIVGVLALGGVMWQRRRKAKQAS